MYTIQSDRCTRFLFASLLLIAPASSWADFYTSAPQTHKEYEHIFGVEPAGAEMKEIEQVVQSKKSTVHSLRSVDDFEAALKSSSDYLIIVGHNNDGEFRFPTGPGRSIKQMSDQIERANKLAVFLTCRGACYTSDPTNLLRTNFADSVVTAEKIEVAIKNLRESEKNHPPPMLPPPISTPTTPQSTPPGALTPAQCKAIFAAVARPVPTLNPARFKREINRVIHRHEAVGVVKSSWKLLAALSGPAVLVYALGDNSNN